MRTPSIFTPQMVSRIWVMKAAGLKTAEIARVVGTTPNSLRARCSQLKKSKLPKSAEIAA
jgi:hypothetical protein